MLCSDAVLERELHREAERAHRARDDGDLVDRVGVRHERRDQRVPGLVVRDDVPLVVGEHVAPPLDAGRQPIGGLLEVALARPARWSWRAASSAASFTRLARSAPEKPGVRAAMLLDVEPGRVADLLQVHLEDLHAAAHVGQVDDDAAIEAAGAQQRRVEHLGPVGRREQDDALRGVEAVHLDQQLVQRLLLLVVTADARRSGARATCRPRRARR